jgi:prevent-host-death family protein
MERAMHVSVRELKNRLSEYLRRVQAGEEIVITSRGRPVARLAPPPESSLQGEEELIRRFRASPWVRPALGRRRELPEPLLRVAPGEKTLAEIVSEQRK